MQLLRVMAPVLSALALVAGMSSVTAAQDVPEATPGASVPEGLERWYSRNFSADPSAILAPATPGATPSGWLLLATNVLEFETDEQAAAGVDSLLEQFEAGFAAEDIQMEDVELDLDLDYSARRADGALLPGTVIFEAVAQDGEYVYAVVAATLGIDPAPLVESTIEAMAAAEVEGEETFSADGASDGGLWTKLPTIEQITALEPPLTTAEDAILYPTSEEEGTPAS